ncbi:MAG: PstS family phosphate ABC transporter substrate-binding protein [Desulfomonilaceae bacterium]
MNKRYLTMLGLVLALLLTAMVCFSEAQDQAGKIIRIRGSNIMASLVDNWAKAFSASNPGIRVMVSGGGGTEGSDGTATGLEALFDKRADLTMASRQINEKEVQAAALSGSKPFEVPVGRVIIAIITHPENRVQELTLEQLRKTFTGDYTRWSEVGGTDEPVAVITNQQTSGVALFLRTNVMENGYFTSDAGIRDLYHNIIREISKKKPPAIGYAGLVDAQRGAKNNLIKILGIKKAADSPAVLPSAGTVKNHSYPLSVPVYFYYDSASAGDEVKIFVEFCKDRG